MGGRVTDGAGWLEASHCRRRVAATFGGWAGRGLPAEIPTRAAGIGKGSRDNNQTRAGGRDRRVCGAGGASWWRWNGRRRRMARCWAPREQADSEAGGQRRNWRQSRCDCGRAVSVYVGERMTRRESLVVLCCALSLVSAGVCGRPDAQHRPRPARSRPRSSYSSLLYCRTPAPLLSLARPLLHSRPQLISSPPRIAVLALAIDQNPSLHFLHTFDPFCRNPLYFINPAAGPSLFGLRCLPHSPLLPAPSCQQLAVLVATAATSLSLHHKSLIPHTSTHKWRPLCKRRLPALTLYVSVTPAPSGHDVLTEPRRLPSTSAEAASPPTAWRPLSPPPSRPHISASRPR